MKVFIEKIAYENAMFRTPLKFGASVVSELTLPVVTARISEGPHEGIGTGAMPLGNAWSFPAAPHDQSLTAMKRLADAVAKTTQGIKGDSIFEVSHELEERTLALAHSLSLEMQQLPSPIPKLCALVVFSAFDIAAFDAWGKMHRANTFMQLAKTPEGNDLSRWLDSSFRDFGLKRFLPGKPVDSLPLFHLIGGLDALTPTEVTKPIGDGLPEHLEQWIEKDQITHFKIKLRGDDADWDYRRILDVERIASTKVRGSPVYSLDFNEKCRSGAALVDLLMRVKNDCPRAFDRIAYVEQPTSRDLADRPENDMHAAAELKPVAIDEGLTSYEAFQRARELGYSGVALKACKGIGPSLLMAAACRKEKLFLCVQDLTCPGLSLLASTSLAAWLGVEAIEANARQFCPAANAEWARRRPEVFTIRNGRVDTRRFDSEGLGFCVM